MILDEKWVNHPSVVGFEWKNTYENFPGETYEHQLIWPRGTNGVSYATRVVPRNTHWTYTAVVNPERLGFDGTRAGFEKLVAEFLKEEA